MHDVIRAYHAGQRAAHDGVGEDPVKLGYRRQQVVAGVEGGVGANQRVEPLVDAAMEAIRQLRAQAEIAMRDEVLHLGVSEEFWGGHGRRLRSHAHGACMTSPACAIVGAGQSI